MAVTDKQAEKARERVERLRQQVQDERDAILTATASREAEYNKARYDAEADRLEAELAALKAQRKTAEAVMDATIESVANPVVVTSDAAPPDPAVTADEKEK